MLSANKGRIKISSLKDIPTAQAQISTSNVPIIQSAPAPIVIQAPTPAIHVHTQVINQDISALLEARAQTSKAQKVADDNLKLVKQLQTASEESTRLAKETEIKRLAEIDDLKHKVEQARIQGETHLKETELKNSVEIDNLKLQLVNIQNQFNELQEKNNAKISISTQDPTKENKSKNSKSDSLDALGMLFKHESTSPTSSTSPGNSQQTSPRVGGGKNDWENIGSEDLSESKDSSQPGKSN